MSTVLAFVLGVVLTVAAIPVVRWVNEWRDRARNSASLQDSRVTTVSQVLHLVVQGAPTAITVVDRAGEVILSNSRAHEMAIVHDRTLNPEVWVVGQEVFEDLETRTIDLAMPRRSTGNRVSDVKALIKPLTLVDNYFIIVYGTDESENVRMESARRDFVANVSHELKTPVGGMSLLAEALLQDPNDPDMVEYFGNKLLNESHRMAELITELISLSKLQGAEALPEMMPVKVDEVIDEAMSRNQISADNAGIKLTRGDRTGVEVMGDRPMLVMAVSNLISNAVNYSSESQPVSITQKIVRENVILIRVTDRGIGIEPENQKRVFERFFRVDKARSRQTGGTGLGLAIVKHVVANHSGNIKLWSRPGTGSTFTIELPIYVPEPEPEQLELLEEDDQPSTPTFREAVTRATARRKEKEKQ
ncbi:sensor histidine kinase [Corynebacterium lubricantis]|uniref:sensor histidine kinase n=1 Tax=Corynebacterium lubricantis TaxID=541095 RepID=UPI0003777DDF|nr:ATP-binding protein [Corynebacterium lubricantis]